MVAGHADSGGRAASRAASTSLRRASSSAARSSLSASPVAARERRLLRAAGGVRRDLPAAVLEEELDLALGLLELGVAQAGEADAFLVEDERLLEGQVTLLELLHDLVQLLEGGLEARRLLGAHGSSFPVTRA